MVLNKDTLVTLFANQAEYTVNVAEQQQEKSLV